MKIAPTFLFLACLLAFGSVSAQELEPRPVILSASIDPSAGFVLVRWQAPKDLGGVVVSYDISRIPFTLDGQFPVIPTAQVGGTVLEYRDNVTDANTLRQSYRIRANADPSGASSNSEMIHVPISNLSGQYNACSNELDLRWLPYAIFFINNQTSKVDQNKPYPLSDSIKYEVWGYTDDLSSVFDGTKSVRLTERSPSNLDVKVKVKESEENKTYYFYVKAFLPTGDSATSSFVSVITSNRELPEYMRIDTVASVAGNILLHFDIASNTFSLDPSRRVDTFALYRSDVKFRPIEWFYSIKSIPKIYTDSRGLSLGQVYTYNLVAIRCGKHVMQSDTVSNVLLYVQPSGRMTQVRWTEFINQYPDDTRYTLKRTVPLPARTLLEAGAGVRSYLDERTVDSLCAGPRQFCYLLTASGGNTTAISQVECLTLEPSITMPNAIDPSRGDIVSLYPCVCCPAGYTTRARNLFGPILDLDPLAYKATLEIFNRSGLRIFSAIKNYDGAMPPYWDGTYRNKQVQEGVYVYGLRLEFKSGFPPQTQRGTLTVVYSD